jgi:hypothetical protein
MRAHTIWPTATLVTSALPNCFEVKFLRSDRGRGSNRQPIEPTAYALTDFVIFSGHTCAGRARIRMSLRAPKGYRVSSSLPIGTVILWLGRSAPSATMVRGIRELGGDQ